MLRVGLIGCGERGANFPAYLRRTTNTRLAMVMDANPSLAEDLGRRFGVAWTAKQEELLESNQVDAVIISTPHHLHAPQAIAAAQAGKHVMVEKPLAATMRDGIEVLRVARQKGVYLSTILSYRYQPHVQRAKALVDSGALGDIFGFYLVYQDDKFSGYWRSGHSGRATSDWRQRWDTSGGGVLITSVIHQIDWLRYLTGREVVEASATYTTLDSPGEVEDSICLWIRYDNGAIGTVNASSCVRGADIIEFRIWGRDGHISLTAPPQFYTLRNVDGKRPGQWHDLPLGKKPMQRDVEYIQRFSDRVLRGEAPEITGEDGLAAQAIVEAAYRSAQSGRVMPVEGGPWGLDAS